MTQVSLIIPLRDEESTVAPLIDSIIAQRRRPDEVIFVDAGSQDRTAELLSEACGRFPEWRVIPLGPAFPGVARNRGVQESRFPYIAFTDGGIRLSPDWLEKLCRPVEESDTIDLIYGVYEPVLDSWFKECAALAYVPPRAARSRFTAGLMLSRRLWDETDGFPPFRAAEDLIFLESAERLSRSTVLTDAVVYWQIAGNWTSTFHRFSLYSRHNLFAGRARQHHFGVMRYWMVAAGIGALAATFSPWALCLLPAGLGARTARLMWQKRDSFPQFERTSTHALGVTMIVLMIDIATLWGIAVYLLQDWPNARSSHGAE